MAETLQGDRVRGSGSGGTSITDSERVAVTGLPVIDIAPFMRSSTLEERLEVARALRRACIDIGFFYLVGHDFKQADFDEVLAAGRRFFARPLAEKEKLSRRSDVDLGFRHTGGVDANSDRVPDIKERLFLSRELMAGETPRGGFAAGNSKWPDPQAVPGFEDIMKGYIARQVGLTKVLARAFALSLDLPEDYFDEPFARPEVTLGLNFYPSVDSSQSRPGQWSFAPHSDYGAFTILLQDNSGGLQACNTSGEWIDVPPRENALVVNLGDLFPRWTNDLYVSTLHRGLHADAQEARISAAFFVSPRQGTIVECLETCQGPDNPPRYPPVESEEYANQLRAAAYHEGTPGIAPMTAERLKQG